MFRRKRSGISAGASSSWCSSDSRFGGSDRKENRPTGAAAAELRETDERPPLVEWQRTSQPGKITEGRGGGREERERSAE